MFKKPWTNGACAYHEVDSFSDLAIGFKKSRKVKSFILTDQGVEKIKPTCAYCGKIITVKDGNRGTFYPKTKKVRIEHYECAWKNLLGYVYGKLYDAIM